MKKLLLVSLAVIALSGCNPSNDKVISIGTEEFSQSLKDPGSAEFKEVFFKKDNKKSNNIVSGYVCGMVNAKNGFGAYIGFRPFYIHVSASPRFLIPILGVNYGSSDAGSVDDIDRFYEFKSRCGDRQNS